MGYLEKWVAVVIELDLQINVTVIFTDEFFLQLNARLFLYTDLNYCWISPGFFWTGMVFKFVFEKISTESLLFTCGKNA